MFVPKGEIISVNSESISSVLSNSKIYSMENEYSEALLDKIINKLLKQGYIVRDCTPREEKFDNMGQTLSQVVKCANKSTSSLHLSLHFEYGKSDIIECWVNYNGSRAEKLAIQICDNLNKKGVTKALVRIGKLYITNYTKMPCIVFRFGYLGDKDEFKNIYSENLSSCIVQGILGEDE